MKHYGYLAMTFTEYEPGDRVPCCGCEPVQLSTVAGIDCSCQCHDGAKAFLHLVPNVAPEGESA